MQVRGTDFLLGGNAEERERQFPLHSRSPHGGDGRIERKLKRFASRVLPEGGRNLSRVAHATLKRNLALINARPRKVLNFHSAQELLDFELSFCCT